MMRWISRPAAAATWAVGGLLGLGLQATHAAAGTVDVPAAAEWVDTGVDVQPSQRVFITASGTWTNGGPQRRSVGPDGIQGSRNVRALMPRRALGALIGRVGPQVFFVGSRYGDTSGTGGRLFLAMNDVRGGFGDNAGAVQATIDVELSTAATLGSNRLLPRVFVNAERVQGTLYTAFSGGRLQLSQTDEGTPLTLPLALGGTRTYMSYVSFGPQLRSRGVEDFPIELGPVKEFSLEQLRNSFGWNMAAQFLLFGNTVMVDRMRFLLNDVRAEFDRGLSVRLEDGKVLLDLKLEDADDAIRGEGNGYTSLPFVIPIPLGWEDGLGPDMRFADIHIVVALQPVVEEEQVRLSDPQVEIVGVPTLSILDELVADRKNEMLQEAREKLAAEFRKNGVKVPLEAELTRLLLDGRANEKVVAVNVASNGTEVIFAFTE